MVSHLPSWRSPSRWQGGEPEGYRPYRVYILMVTKILKVCQQNTRYFARLVVVVFPVFATLKFGQTTLLTEHHYSSQH